MKFGFGGIKATVSARHIQDAVNLVAFGETIGYDIAWFGDTRSRDTYVIMTLCGLHTRRIQLGTGVTNPFWRHPLKTAEAIATVDEVTCGRAILGISSGNLAEMLRPMGYDTRDHYLQVKEAVQVIRNAFSEPREDHVGRFFTVPRHLGLGFTPFRRDLPIYVAGNGPKMLEAAGEIADGVIIGHIDEALFKKALGHVEKGCAKVGKTLADLDIALWTTVFIEDAGIMEKEKFMDHYLKPGMTITIMHSPSEWFIGAGMKAEHVEAIKKEYIIGAHIDPVLEQQLAQKIKAYVTEDAVKLHNIIGSADECLEQIERLIRLGATNLIVHVSPLNIYVKRKILESVADRIITRFR